MEKLVIGHVIRVHGDSVDVQICCEDLDIEHAGKLHRVGRIGSYVVVPVTSGEIIGYVTSVETRGELEPRPNPGAPRRIMMTVQLLGMVRKGEFARGVDEYPVLGDPVRLGLEDDFITIFGAFVETAFAEKEYPRSFSIGRFAIDPEYEVYCLGREFFGKHVAVMGNSGSGKSCTTAKIVHEVLRLPHSQIVMFDMHGEYLSAFADENLNPDVNVTYLSDRNLVLPYWMLRYEEFEQVFLDANNPANINAQRVFLRGAFEKLKRAAAEELNLVYDYTIDTPVYYSLDQLRIYSENMNNARYVLGSQSYAFSRLPFRQMPPAEQEKLVQTRRMEFNQGNPEGEVAHATFHSRLLGLVNQLETRLNDRRYDFLLRPFEAAKRNPDLGETFRENMTAGELSRATSQVLRQLLGRLNTRKNLTIIDLSGLPFDVVDITVAVLTRALFEFNFWSPVDVRQPVLLVYEEAHNYLPRDPKGRKTFARDAVEKVAKEGRKYGVSAMIVTQRPSEISETVLSQCNTMVLMRMNNPDDQDFAARVVTDQFRTLISLLPGLRPGEAFILGDAVLMPMRTLVDRPPRMPRSANMDFFRLWQTGGKEGDVEHVIDRWWRQTRSDNNAAPATAPNATVTDKPAVNVIQRQPSMNGAESRDRPGFIREDPPPEPERHDAPATAEDVGADDETQSPKAQEQQPSTAQGKLAALAALLSGKNQNSN